MAAKFIVLGSTDEVNTCDCCGKHPLKATWAVEMIEADGSTSGNILYYGSVCVTRNTGKTMKEVRSEAEAAHKEKVETARKELRAHPAYLADRAKIAEAERLGIAMGKLFADFHRAEMLQVQEAKAEIASKYKLDPNSFYA